MDTKDLKSITLRFGDEEQIKFVREQEAEEVLIQKAKESPKLEMDFREKTMYTAVCPHCDAESEWEESEDEAIFSITRKLKDGTSICYDCGKRIKE